MSRPKVFLVYRPLRESRKSPVKVWISELKMVVSKHTFWSHKFTTAANLFKMGKASTVKQRIMTHKKRKGFMGKLMHIMNEMQIL